MKKNFLAVIVAAIAACMCIPFASGCSAELVYTLNEDENGEKYYTVSCEGYLSGLRGDFVIPSEYSDGADAYPVREIAAEGFSNTRISKLTIPSSVTKIGTAAFMCCYSLQEVVFEQDSPLEILPQGVFGYCEALRSVALPDNLTTIGNLAFYSCSGLESITLPSEVRYIQPQAFEYCFELKEVVLPEKLETIGFRAFYYTSLEEVTVPASVHDYTVTSIDDDGNEVQTYVYGIGIGAFHSCQQLKKAVINGGIERLAPGVFGFCTALEEVYLPSSLNKVEGAYYTSDGSFYCGHAFTSCTSLTDVYFGGGEEEWAAVRTDSASVTENGVKYDNSYFLNAAVHFNAEF